MPPPWMPVLSSYAAEHYPSVARALVAAEVVAECSMTAERSLMPPLPLSMGAGAYARPATTYGPLQSRKYRYRHRKYHYSPP